MRSVFGGHDVVLRVAKVVCGTSVFGNGVFRNGGGDARG